MWRALRVALIHVMIDWSLFWLSLRALFRLQYKCEISIIALITANFSVNGAAVKSDNRRGTRISHGPYKRDERGRKHPWTLHWVREQDCNLKHRGRRRKEGNMRRFESGIKYPAHGGSGQPIQRYASLPGGANSAWQPLPREPESPPFKCLPLRTVTSVHSFCCN